MSRKDIKSFATDDEDSNEAKFTSEFGTVSVTSELGTVSVTNQNVGDASSVVQAYFREEDQEEETGEQSKKTKYISMGNKCNENKDQQAINTA